MNVKEEPQWTRQSYSQGLAAKKAAEQEEQRQKEEESLLVSAATEQEKRANDAFSKSAVNFGSTDINDPLNMQSERERVR